MTPTASTRAAQTGAQQQAAPAAHHAATPAVEIRGLWFQHAQGAAALNLSSLVIEPGEQLCITGASGSGKSTLLSLICGLLTPQQGTVRVDGHDLAELSPARRDAFRGRHIGMVFQTFNLLSGFSALENVMLAMTFGRIPRNVHRERAELLLRHLGIERMDAAPEQLSIGQQQRVAVARAVACRPALVLADEPTASLDPEAGAAAIDLIRTTCREEHAALLCVTHDPSVAASFPRAVSLAELTRPAAQGGTR